MLEQLKDARERVSKARRFHANLDMLGLALDRIPAMVFLLRPLIIHR